MLYSSSIPSTPSPVCINPSFDSLQNHAISDTPSISSHSSPTTNIHDEILPLESPENTSILALETHEQDALFSNTSPMGLKRKEKILDDLKKENFGLKMRIYYLTETLQSMSPQMHDEILLQFSEMKALMQEKNIQVNELTIELRDAHQEISELHAHPWLNRPDYINSETQTDVDFSKMQDLITDLEIQLKETTHEATHLATLYDSKRQECLELSKSLAETLESNRIITLKLQSADLAKNNIQLEFQKIRLEQEHVNSVNANEVFKLNESLQTLSGNLLESENIRLEQENKNQILATKILESNELLTKLSSNLNESETKYKILETSHSEQKEIISSLETQIQILNSDLKTPVSTINYQSELEKLKSEVSDNHIMIAQLKNQHDTELEMFQIASKNGLREIENKHSNEMKNIILTVESYKAQIEELKSQIVVNEKIQERTKDTKELHEKDKNDLQPSSVKEEINDELTNQIRNKYITELKDRNTCLVKVNQTLDYFLSIKSGTSQIRDFAGLRESICSKLDRVAMEFNAQKQYIKNYSKKIDEYTQQTEYLKLKNDELERLNVNLKKDNAGLQLQTFDNSEKDNLKKELREKTKYLQETNRRLKYAKEQYAELLKINNQKEKMIGSALSKLTELSGNEKEMAEIKACFLD